MIRRDWLVRRGSGAGDHFEKLFDEVLNGFAYEMNEEINEVFVAMLVSDAVLLCCLLCYPCCPVSHYNATPTMLQSGSSTPVLKSNQHSYVNP